jgi:hypothetical protein
MKAPSVTPTYIDLVLKANPDQVVRNEDAAGAQR